MNSVTDANCNNTYKSPTKPADWVSNLHAPISSVAGSGAWPVYVMLCCAMPSTSLSFFLEARSNFMRQTFPLIPCN